MENETRTFNINFHSLHTAADTLRREKKAAELYIKITFLRSRTRLSLTSEKEERRRGLSHVVGAVALVKRLMWLVADGSGVVFMRFFREREGGIKTKLLHGCVCVCVF
jgi:hypothetical protein